MSCCSFIHSAFVFNTTAGNILQWEFVPLVMSPIKEFPALHDMVNTMYKAVFNLFVSGKVKFFGGFLPLFHSAAYPAGPSQSYRVPFSGSAYQSQEAHLSSGIKMFSF